MSKREKVLEYYKEWYSQIIEILLENYKNHPYKQCELRKNRKVIKDIYYKNFIISMSKIRKVHLQVKSTVNILLLKLFFI